MGLTGNYAVDKPTLEMLKTEIMKGIKLNEMNLKAVSNTTSICWAPKKHLLTNVKGRVPVRPHPAVPSCRRDGQLLDVSLNRARK